MASYSGGDKEHHLIIVCLTDDSYYAKHVGDIIQFSKDLSFKVLGSDKLLVISPRSLSSSFQSGYAPGTYFMVYDDSIDLWARDFGLVIPKSQVKFVYRPGYMKKSDATWIDEQVGKVLMHCRLQYVKSNIILDGGNVVDNGVDKAIISERIFKDNKCKSKAEFKKEVESLLQHRVAFVPDPGDSTGHADGIVSFIEEDVLLIGDYSDEGFYNEVKEAILAEFPDLKIVKLPCPINTTKWKNIDSAIGVYVNILVTENAVYLPTFANPQQDEVAFDIVQSHTTKRVVGVDTSRLGHMGGNVRCMTWQVKMSHSIAKGLISSSNVAMPRYGSPLWFYNGAR